MDQTHAPENAKNGDTANPTNTPTGGTTNTPNPEAGAADKPESADGMNLMAALIEAQAKSKEYLDSWQRERAEFANYRRRVDRERDEVYQTATIDTLKKLLPVIDDFDRALTSVPAEKANEDLAKGVTLIHRKMLSLLDVAGVKLINPVGEAFDPKAHEAIGHDESDTVETGHVSTVLQKGYMYGDKVIRPAIVRVAR